MRQLEDPGVTFKKTQVEPGVTATELVLQTSSPRSALARQERHQKTRL